MMGAGNSLRGHVVLEGGVPVWRSDGGPCNHYPGSKVLICLSEDGRTLQRGGTFAPVFDR
jgi:hypothetical protein